MSDVISDGRRCAGVKVGGGTRCKVDRVVWGVFVHQVREDFRRKRGVATGTTRKHDWYRDQKEA